MRFRYKPCSTESRGAALMDVSESYLSRYGEPEQREAEFIPGVFRHVLVIPSAAEGSGALRTLDSVPAGVSPQDGAVLVILVINANDETLRHLNRETVAACKRAYRVWTAPGRTTLFDMGLGRNLAVIDRGAYGPGFAAKEGVGLARKIGCDLALRLQVDGRLRSAWIHCTDADVRLPSDYFARIEEDEVAAAVVYPFRHDEEGTDAQVDAVRLHEIWMHYYVLGLRYAESPYAFHTIGSTLAVRGRAYAAVRGFPRRTAGEDFYLLDKVAKVGAIAALGGEPIQLSGRRSSRVPFGTGARVGAWVDAGAPVETFQLDDPEIFRCLRVWLATVREVCRSSSEDPKEVLAAQLSAANVRARESLFDALQEGGAFAGLERARRSACSADARLRAAHTHFAALRTLRCLHALRDRAYPPVPWKTALATAPFVAQPVGLPPHEALRASACAADRRGLAFCRFRS